MLENSQTVIAGAGHAGVEAALILAEKKQSVVLVTMDKSAIGRLSCNPAIGGLGKTHLVKEIDALGGIMGAAADAAAIQYKTLNKTKGRAVWSLRAQIDKKMYPKYVQKKILSNKYISVIEDEIISFKTKSGKINRAVLKNSPPIFCDALIVTCGTFLNGLIHIGMESYSAGRMGEKNSHGLTETLADHGFITKRLKTGTPPRLSAASIDFHKLTVANGDDPFSKFSLFSNHKKKIAQEPCYLTNTNKETHNIINSNIHLSPMFSGKINAIGPRYCPSVEDKVFRFKDRESHHLFLEPEWKNSNQIYVNGFSTSLPKNIQEKSLKTVDGLKNVEFIRPGYAIEYDFIPPYQLKSSLESKLIEGLFLAGQINGTSGYEEAAAQGLIAGINAFKLLQKESPLILSRSSSYIGVMIDDLVTTHLDEPYRMFTSRAEHRLYLRCDNVYSRLFHCSSSILSSKKLKTCENYFKQVSLIRSRLKDKRSPCLVPALKHIKRPESSINSFFSAKTKSLSFYNWGSFEVETSIKYEGYIENEAQRISALKKLDSLSIPENFNFNNISSLSNESIERLSKIKPENIGQASRVFGIRPTDLIALSSYIKNVSRET